MFDTHATKIKILTHNQEKTFRIFEYGHDFGNIIKKQNGPLRMASVSNEVKYST